MLGTLHKRVLVLVACAASAAAQAQQIVMVSSHASAPYRATLAGMRAVTREAGATVVEVSPGDLRKALVEGRVSRSDFFVALGAKAASPVLDLVAPGHAMSCLTLAAAGMPGVLLAHSATHRIELLKRLLPDARVIGVLYRPGANPQELEALAAAARSMGRRIVARPVAEPADLEGQLNRLADEADVLLATYDPGIYSPANAAVLIQFSYRHLIPFVGMGDSWSKAGALIGVDWDFTDLGHQCGTAALQLSAGVRLDPDPQRPRRMTYSINAATARLLRANLFGDAIRGARAVYE